MSLSLLGFKKTFGEIENACMQPTRLLSLTDSLCVVATCRKMHLLNLHQEKQLGNKLNEDITRVRLHTDILKEITTNHTSIQSLCMLRTNEEGKFSIASVDSTGRTALSVLKCPSIQESPELITYSSSSSSSSSFYTHAPTHIYQGAGWAGVAALPNTTTVATCSYLHKKFTMVDMGGEIRPLRCLNTMKNPTAINSMDENCVAISEGGLFSVWDSRVSASDGFILRETVVDGRSRIWTLCMNQRRNEILAAGSDRNIYIYDIRNLNNKLKCSTPCKFDIVKILSSSSLTDKFYVCGYDNEVLLCDVSRERHNAKPSHEKKGGGDKRKGEKRAREVNEDRGDKLHMGHVDAGEGDNSNSEKHLIKNIDSSLARTNVAGSSKLKEQHERGFKAQSNWVGLDVISDGCDDSIHGLCEWGNIYMLKHAQVMNSHSNGQ